jgi:hypothetical protein
MIYKTIPLVHSSGFHALVHWEELEATGLNNMHEVQKWTSSPPVRGSTDILWSCLSTLGLCVWTAVHPNVPLVYRLRRAVCHRLGLMALAIIFPEIIISEALNQRLLARRLMLDVNQANHYAVSQPFPLFSRPGDSRNILITTDSTTGNPFTNDARVRSMEPLLKWILE